MSVDEVAVAPAPDLAAPVPAPRPTGPGPSGTAGAPTATAARGVAKAIVGWAVGTVVVIVIVLYGLSPLFQQRDQHKLLTTYRTDVRQASLQATGLFGVTLPDEPPATGSPVGIVDIGRLHLQDVVTEGVGPSQTAKGPGHVPGTAGLGQPGNSAIVARHHAFDGPFSDLGSLRKGDPIVVTTTEGQSLYVVSQVRAVRLRAGSTPSTTALGFGSHLSTTPTAPTRLGATMGVDNLFGVSSVNQLTLVTSDSVLPWNTSSATVVVATMKTTPFTPTPQQARSASETGRSGESGGWAPFVLALQAFILVVVGAVALYRRTPLRTAYLVSTAPLVVTSVLLAVTLSRMLPAWT